MNKQTLNDEGIIALERKLEAGKICAMHWHDYIELEYIISGKAEHIYNSEVYELHEGHAYIVTHHDLHAFRAVSNISLINICFDINLLDKELSKSLLYSENKRLCCAFEGETSQYILSACKQLIQEKQHNTEYSHLLAKYIISQIVAEIISESSTKKNHSPSLSQRAIECIHTGFKEELSLSILADRLSVTPNYLGRVIMKKTGMSFNTYLNHIRLRYACNMLMYSSMTVKEIAAMSGYSSIEHFFYIFKKQLGVPPLEYKKINTPRLMSEGISTNYLILNQTTESEYSH